MNVLGGNWIFRTKLNYDGSFDKLKAGLIAKRFNQEEWIDYLDNYSQMIQMPCSQNYSTYGEGRS